MTAMGRGLFSLYIFKENFKNLLVRNHRTGLNIICQKCFFGDSLPNLFKPYYDSSKNMAAGAWGLGLSYPSLKIFAPETTGLISI